MVVVYQTASEGSWASFFVQTPKIIFHQRGSIIPKVFPQVLLVVGMAVLARWWNPLVNAGADVQNGMAIMSILLSFLMVFKTHSAYDQYFTALGHSERLLHTLRDVVMTACTFFPTDRSSPSTVARSTRSNTPDSPTPPLIPSWSGGVLRIRVLSAYQLVKPDGPSKPYTVVRVGSECFKTGTSEDARNPVWDSEVFQFLVGSEDALVSFVVLGQEKLGWLHLSSTEVLQFPEQRWHRLRRRLRDGGVGELELEISFAGKETIFCQGQEVELDEHCSWKLAPADEVKSFLAGVGLEPIRRKLKDAGFTTMEALDCIEDVDMDELGMCMAHRAVLRRRLRERKYAIQSRGSLMPVNAYLRRTVRYIALFYFVIVEYFRRTGFNAVSSINSQDKMREDIKTLTGDKEFAILYPGDTKDVVGSKSPNAYTNPMIVLYWIQFNISTCAQAHNIPSPVAASMIPKISNLGETFCDMNKIDKLQFPLPYAQVVKILCIVFVFLTPWVLQPSCKDLTELVVGLIAMGFFGLDEVAEIIESPFGNDANHINLRCYGEHLLDDLEMIYYSRESREKQLDTVFTESEVRRRRMLFESTLKEVEREEEEGYNVRESLTESARTMAKSFSRIGGLGRGRTESHFIADEERGAAEPRKAGL